MSSAIEKTTEKEHQNTKQLPGYLVLDTGLAVSWGSIIEYFARHHVKVDSSHCSPDMESHVALFLEQCVCFSSKETHLHLLEL